ncbi:MAG: class I SAM-dependent methyltransferase [Desulfobacterales bacterium]|nr:class I SAM-dependent methyltransferase [Desulfobacterales bacterium]
MRKYAAETLWLQGDGRQHFQGAAPLCRGVLQGPAGAHFWIAITARSRGAFDKIVSVGMFEHVGCKNYRTFMQVVHRQPQRTTASFCCTPSAATSPRRTCDPWITKYIFPNGMLPSHRPDQPIRRGPVCQWRTGTTWGRITTRPSWPGTNDFQKAWPRAAEEIRRTFQAHVGILPALLRRRVSRPQQSRCGRSS